MADFAPQRGGQPIRSVITVAELLGRRHVPAGVSNGRIPAVRTAVSVSALMRREGKTHHPGRPLGPRAERMYTGLSSASTGRKMANAAGGMLTVGALASAAALFGNTVPGPTSSSALDGGYPGQNGLLGGGAQPFGMPLLDSDRAAPGDGGVTPVAVGTAPATGLLPRGLASGKPVVLPPAAAVGDVPAVVGASSTGTVPSSSAGGSSSGGAVGDVADALVGGQFGAAVDNTAGAVGTVAEGGVDTVTGVVGNNGRALGDTMRSVGNSLPVAGPLVSGLGSVVSHTTRSLSGTLDPTADSLVGGLLDGSSSARSHSSSRSDGGSALSSLTNPITHQDAISKSARSVTGLAGSLLGDSDDGSYGRHSTDRLSSRSDGSGSLSGSERHSGGSDGFSRGGRDSRHADGGSSRHFGGGSYGSSSSGGDSYGGGSHGGGSHGNSGHGGSGSGGLGGKLGRL